MGVAYTSQLNMASQLQMHLGPSPTNSLAIIEPDPQSSPAGAESSSGIHKRTTAQSRLPKVKQLARNLLLQLPDEILALIVELALNEDDSEKRIKVCHSRTARVLTKVCHRLRRLARPLLLRDIRLEYPHQLVPPCITVKNLHRTLRNRPHLRKHCR